MWTDVFNKSINNWLITSNSSMAKFRFLLPEFYSCTVFKSMVSQVQSAFVLPQCISSSILVWKVVNNVDSRKEESSLGFGTGIPLLTNHERVVMQFNYNSASFKLLLQVHFFIFTCAVTGTWKAAWRMASWMQRCKASTQLWRQNIRSSISQSRPWTMCPARSNSALKTKKQRTPRVSPFYLSVSSRAAGQRLIWPCLALQSIMY